MNTDDISDIASKTGSACRIDGIYTEKSVAFTGHRPKNLACGYDESHAQAVWIKRQLDIFIAGAARRGITHFITGGALGVDTWSAEAVLRARVRRPELRLIVAVPYAGQGAMWPESSRARYRGILEQADRVEVLAPGYTNRCMQKRNEWMVDRVLTVCAVYNGSPTGGTRNCVGYAYGSTCRIWVINPNNYTVGWVRS